MGMAPIFPGSLPLLRMARALWALGCKCASLPLQASTPTVPGGVSSIGQADRDAADQGADIINMSLELSADTFALALCRAICCGPGGDDHCGFGQPKRTTVSYPAAYPSVMAVGASTVL